MKSMRMRIGCAACLILSAGSAAALNLHDATLAPAANLSNHEKKAVQMLVEETEKRTGLRWSTSGNAQNHPVITIHHADGAGPSEGYRLTVRAGAVDVQGND